MTEQSSTLPVNSADIDAAARVLAPFAVRTPLLSSPALDERVGRQGFPETGNAAADRIVQVPRRLQQDVVDPGERARRRRGRVLLRQSRPGRGGGGANPEHAGDHRDAGRRAALQARAHQGLWRRGRAVRSRPRGSRGHRPRHRRQARRHAGAALRRPHGDRGPGHRGPGDRRGHGRARRRAGYRGGAGLRRRPGRGRRDRGQGALSAGLPDVRRTGRF